MWKNWGFEKLAKKEYEESVGEMKHADKLVERILVIEGLPNLQDLGKLKIGEDVPEGLKCDLGMERKGREDLLVAIAACEEATDYVSRHILRHILDDTEEHIDWLETQLELIEKVGVQNYLQSQM
jgi:bacterioferritin